MGVTDRNTIHSEPRPPYFWLGVICAVALIARVGFVLTARSYLLEHVTYEYGEIAANLLAGKGFSIRFLGAEGPTSSQAPVYPPYRHGFLLVLRNSKRRCRILAANGAGGNRQPLARDRGYARLGARAPAARDRMARRAGNSRSPRCSFIPPPTYNPSRYSQFSAPPSFCSRPGPESAPHTRPFPTWDEQQYGGLSEAS
ncbi:MAG: hypothetical protein KatS3mg027_0003 [Bacteroidia bacterium]|nr:MAG: hypothetical protein KatS3mg027_0003 [Bacteroidia bacterium]